MCKWNCFGYWNSGKSLPKFVNVAALPSGHSLNPGIHPVLETVWIQIRWLLRSQLNRIYTVLSSICVYTCITLCILETLT